jgi:hypothetical protein
MPRVSVWTWMIDELMGHAGGRRGAADGSAIGVRYRHTTPEIEARAVAAIDERLTIALGSPKRSRERPSQA